MLWLGKEMPAWGQPCPLKVTVTYDGSGGATSFAFDRGSILSIDMHIEGTLERLVHSVLPHEVTHTVFAYHFRQPVPRWADEGGSVLSEDDQERGRHDKLVREILNSQRRAIPLRRLFALKEYPPDVMVLYAEGYSVTNFLVGRSNRAAFLNFVADGLRQGWDAAVKAHYGFSNVEELEQRLGPLAEPAAPADTTLTGGTARTDTTTHDREPADLPPDARADPGHPPPGGPRRRPRAGRRRPAAPGGPELAGRRPRDAVRLADPDAALRHARGTPAGHRELIPWGAPGSLAGVGVPDHHQSVIAGRGQPPAVGAEGDTR